MNNQEDERFFCLHFEGAKTQGHTLPANALVQALQSFQKAVYLIAMAESGKEVRQRARTPRDMEKRYSLVCQVPTEGGYALPMTLGVTDNLLLDVHNIAGFSNKVKIIAGAIGVGDSELLNKYLPDRYYRRSVLSAFNEMQPPRNSGLVISIDDYKKNRILDGKFAKDNIDKLRTTPEPAIPITSGYVSGELVEMKFQERRLKVKLLVSGRGLEANYSEDFEPVLLNHPRDLIQVHGNIVYDVNGIPVSISDVDEILEIDDSPIEVEQFEANGSLYKAKRQISFPVKFDVETQLFEIEGDFGIVLGAETRPYLESQLYAELSMLWVEYAEASEDILTETAKALKLELINSFEVLHDAS